MNSSGIKRGLAVSAISALAVAGIPALASPASAAPGDVIQVQSTGTTRSGGDQGAVIVLNTSGIAPADIDIAGTDLSQNGETNATQAVTLIGTPTIITSGAQGDLTPNNGLDQITLRVQVTTPPGGDDVADFVIFSDDVTDNGTPDLTEARTQASVETTGAVTSIDVTPATQTAPSGQPSGAYTVTIRDAEGDLTQLLGNETLTVTSNGDATFGGAGASISDTEIADGTAEFTATGTTTGSQTITVAQGNVSDTAVLNVTASASITLADIDVVTGADSSNGAPAQDPTFVRVDQSSVRLSINSSDAADRNATVTFVVTGNGLTFGGKGTTTVSTTLDGNGDGFVIITPDAGSIQEGDGFAVDGSGITDLDFVFQRATVSAASVDAPARVFTQVDTPTSVTVTVTDQFGNPVQGAQVAATSTGTGVNNTQPRQTTNAAGQTTFTFPAGDTQVGDEDVITYTVFEDAATPNADGIPATEQTRVRYTADGLGPNYQVYLDGNNTEAATYTPATVSVVPLTDADADSAGEIAALTIVNGEAGQPVQVSVSNGALILTGGDTELADGESSATGTVGQTFNIVGTTAGLVTVTVTAGGRTETAQFTVSAQNDTTTARNVGVSGPATVAAGTSQVPFTAVVTDAFGNPVSGVPVTALNVQVSGPGQLQDSDAVSNAQGQIQLNVRLDSDAEGDVTVTVTGVPSGNYQFGAKAGQENPGDPTDDEGLPVSSNVAQATTVVEGDDTPPPPVRETIVATATGSNRASDGYDRVRVSVDKPAAAANAAVELYKVNAQGEVRRVKTKSLNANGVTVFVRKDLNGSKPGKYFAKVRPTETSTGDRTNSVIIK